MHANAFVHEQMQDEVKQRVKSRSKRKRQDSDDETYEPSQDSFNSDWARGVENALNEDSDQEEEEEDKKQESHEEENDSEQADRAPDENADNEDQQEEGEETPLAFPWKSCLQMATTTKDPLTCLILTCLDPSLAG